MLRAESVHISGVQKPVITGTSALVGTWQAPVADPGGGSGGQALSF